MLKPLAKWHLWHAKWQVSVDGKLVYQDHEKRRQVDPATFKAFGVTVESQYGKAAELGSVLLLLDHLNYRDPMILSLIRRVFCVSNPRGVTITFKAEVRERLSEESLKEIAETLAYIIWECKGPWQVRIQVEGRQTLLDFVSPDAVYEEVPE